MILKNRARKSKKKKKKMIRKRNRRHPISLQPCASCLALLGTSLQVFAACISRPVQVGASQAAGVGDEVVW
jgi:hypothetical protein